MMSVELCFGQVPDLTFLEGSMRVLATQYLSLDGVFEEPGKWRLSRVSWNLSGGPPPEACRGVGVGRRQGWCLGAAQHLPHGRLQAGDRHSNSTRPGTTSISRALRKPHPATSIGWRAPSCFPPG